MSEIPMQEILENALLTIRERQAEVRDCQRELKQMHELLDTMLDIGKIDQDFYNARMQMIGRLERKIADSLRLIQHQRSAALYQLQCLE